MISIIVPIYNVEKYLEECLQSIQNQTYKDFECIMINDGSTDSSPEIAQKFVDIDARFKLFHQENKGLSVARNAGLKQGRGDYITFVDSDDTIHTAMLEKLMRYMKEDVDIVECQYSSDYQESGKVDKTVILFQGRGKEALEALVLKKVLTHSAWAKLYRKECFENVLFPEGLNYEDLFLYMKQLNNLHKIVKIDYIGYYYRKNEQSIINSAFSEKNLDIFSICDKIEEMYLNDKEYHPLVYRHLFACIAYHYLNYVEKNNPYKGKYEEYLKKYAAKAQNSGISLQVYKLCPKYFKPLMLLLGKVKNIKGI